MRSFGPDCARGLDVRTQKSSSPVASVSGATGTSKEAGPSEPRQCGDRGTRSRAPTTLVEAVHNAPADVGSIPTVSTFSSESIAARHDQTALVGKHDRLHPVAQAELSEDVRHVRLDGSLADPELSCKLRVRLSGSQQTQHFRLARRELFKADVVTRAARDPRVALDHPPRDRRRQQRIAPGHDPYGSDQLFGR